MSEFIPVGLTAMRDPVTGEPLEAVPLYVEVIDGKEPPLPEIDRKAFARDICRKIRAQKALKKEDR
jgi:hypothetical protein